MRVFYLFTSQILAYTSTLVIQLPESESCSTALRTNPISVSLPDWLPFGHFNVTNFTLNDNVQNTYPPQRSQPQPHVIVTLSHCLLLLELDDGAVGKGGGGGRRKKKEDRAAPAARERQYAK